jgi:hypothetical protein
MVPLCAGMVHMRRGGRRRLGGVEGGRRRREEGPDLRASETIAHQSQSQQASHNRMPQKQQQPSIQKLGAICTGYYSHHNYELSAA